MRPEQNKQLKNLREEKEKKNKKLLKRKIIETKSSKTLREQKAKVLADLKTNHLNVASKLEKLESRKNQRGCIATEENQSGLHQAIFETIAPEVGEDEGRRTEVYNSVRTLNDLHSAFEEKGFKLSQTATYYRFIPAPVNHKDRKGK